MTEQELAELRRAQAILEMDEAPDYQEDGITRDPSTGRIISAYGANEDDRGLTVSFYLKPEYSRALSYEALKERNDPTPKYIDSEWVAVSAPGHATINEIHSSATEYYKWRFPLDYKRFKEGLGEALIGTPLALWPAVTPSIIKDLEFKGIRTVEQMANLSDSITGYQALKAKAKQFLSATKEQAAAGLLQAELDDRDSKHKAEIDNMKQQMAQMAELLKAQAAATKKAKPDA